MIKYSAYYLLLLFITFANRCSTESFSNNCNSAKISVFYYAVSTSSPLFDPTPKTVQVPPEAAAGSKVATVRLLMDEKTLNNTSNFYLGYNTGVVVHNNSGRSLRYWHSNHPLFKLVPSNISSNPTSYIYHHNYYYQSYFNSTAVAKLRELLPVYCTVNSQNYIAISLDLYLLNNSLYHLGDHAVQIRGGFYYQYYYSYSLLYLRVKAGMKSCHKKMFFHHCLLS